MVKKSQPRFDFKFSSANIKKALVGIGIFYVAGLLIVAIGGALYWMNNKHEGEVDSLAKMVSAKDSVTLPRVVLSEPEKLFNRGETTYELAFGRGDTIKISLIAENKIAQLRVKNMDSGNDVFVINQAVGRFDTTFAVKFSAIYQLIINSPEKQYLDLAVTNTSAQNSSVSGLVIRDTVLCEKADEGAIAFHGLDFIKIYKEPQKNTMSSQGKTMLGGRARVIIPVNLPKGTTVWAYQLRISTSNQDKSSDETFVNTINEQYKKVKIFGIPAYEVNKKSTNIVRDLLNTISTPDREEDAFCDFYVFKSAKEADKFSRGGSDYKCYSEYSFQGTQSNQGEVPTEGSTSFFIGLENTRFATSVYTWIDAVATVPTTRYYKINLLRE